MFETLIKKDIELLIYLNNLGTTQWDGFWLFITDKFSAIPLYILLLYGLFQKFGIKKTLAILFFIVILIGITDQTSNLFKYGFERLRPCYNESVKDLIRLVKASCGGKFSYFSAHAANSMAIAVFFSLLLKSLSKYWALLLIFWAILVAYSRIYVGVHFPLDIVSGMFFGVIYALAIYFLMLAVFKKTNF